METDPHWLTLSLEVYGISASVMFLLWLLYLVRDDPAVVDIGWSGSIGLGGCWIYLNCIGGGGRSLFLFVAIAAWSLRMLYLLVGRLLKGQKDLRYETLSAYWEEGLSWKYFLFFQMQAVTVGILLLPAALAADAESSAWSLWDSAAALLFLVALPGELIADQQMAAFRRNPEAKGRVCDVGLWRYSRHPNYFFEWLIWMSYGLFAMNHPLGWIGWLSPALILFFLLKVTGVPPTEAHLLARKGDTYRDYQRRTSLFFPLPPKK